MEANIEELRLRRINSLGNGLKRQIAYPNGEIIIDVEDKTILLNDKVYKFCDIPQIRSESVCSNQFNCYACVRHQIEANDALVMPL